MWARLRAELGAVPAVAVVPKDNILLGRKAIMSYLHINESRTLERWVDEYALPLIYRPDGTAMSSITAIDQWILLAARVTYENKFKAGLTTPQKRARSVQSWRDSGIKPSKTALYRYGTPPEIDEFRPRSVQRHPRRVATELPFPSGYTDPSRERSSQVDPSSSEPGEGGGIQRKDGDSD